MANVAANDSDGKGQANMSYTIEQKQRVLDRFCAPIRKNDLGTGKVELIDTYTGRKISEVSRRYELIQNSEVLTPFVEKFGIDRLTQLFSHQGGRSFYMSIETGREFDLGEGDIIKERFIVQNSYDKTRSFRFTLGAFRKVCTNGLFAFFAGVNFRKIHVGEIPVKDLINRGLEVFNQNNFGVWRKMREIPMEPAEAIPLVEGFEPFEIKERHSEPWKQTQGETDERWIRTLARRAIEAPASLNNQRNLWGVYNNINAAIARGVNSNKEIGRVVTANKRLEEYLIGKFNLN